MSDNVTSELILKIELNESTDKQTTASNLYIKFLNLSDSEHVVDDNNITLNINEDEENLNVKHHLIKRNPENDPINSNLQTNHSYPYPVIPLQQIKGDHSRIKENLDDFKMNKKITYVSTPDYNFPIKINELKTIVDKINYRRQIKQNTISKIERENDIYDIISHQNKLIERIANKLLDTKKRKKKIVRTIFDDILESVEARHTTTGNVTTTTKTNDLTTVLTVVDETEIRNALRKDPFVNRILRMAEKKRQEYEAKRGRKSDFLS